MERSAAFKSLKIVRNNGTLRGQVVEKLRSAIIKGAFVPGERLVERRLVELLGVSRTLVREALRQLETEGFVENWPYKGPAVAVLTLEQVQQIYEMRGALEGLAASLFAERASDADIEAMSATVEAIARYHRAKNPAAQQKAVEHFYDLLLSGAQNDMLTNFVASQRARLSWLRAISLSRRGRSIESIAEKRAIVAALRRRDGARARALAEAHVAAALVGIVQLLGETGSVRRNDNQRITA